MASNQELKLLRKEISLLARINIMFLFFLSSLTACGVLEALFNLCIYVLYLSSLDYLQQHKKKDAQQFGTSVLMINNTTQYYVMTQSFGSLMGSSPDDSVKLVLSNDKILAKYCLSLILLYLSIYLSIYLYLQPLPLKQPGGYW